LVVHPSTLHQPLFDMRKQPQETMAPRLRL
jgi:hypothetical protein